MSLVDQLWSIWGQTRSFVYDIAIVYMTSEWYLRVIHKLPMGAKVLDVGIGTAAALLQHSALIRNQQLHFLGVDIDAAYIQRANDLIVSNQILQNVEARLQSVYDHVGGPYDAIYFSGSFMLMPDPVRALSHVTSQLKPQGANKCLKIQICLLTGIFIYLSLGVVYFTQTFQKERSWLMENIKPMLVYLTSIDFGKVTYEKDFRSYIEQAHMTIEFEEVVTEHSDRTVKLFGATVFVK